ncbi:hypothetical protein J6590_085826 [Homalodisca vitripennis]|nr:hypothetical protein J6590_085826 [Homalodisca vitripennis]
MVSILELRVADGRKTRPHHISTHCPYRRSAFLGLAFGSHYGQCSSETSVLTVVYECGCSGLGLPVLKTVAVPPQLLPEPTAMAAVKLLCAPRLEHSMVLGPVLGQGLGLPVVKAVAVHSSLLLEPTAMAAVTLLYAPRLEHCMVLGSVRGQVAEGTYVLVTSTGTIRGPTLQAVENEIKCADITGNLETKPVNVPNLVSTPSKPREKAGDQGEGYWSKCTFIPNICFKGEGWGKAVGALQRITHAFLLGFGDVEHIFPTQTTLYVEFNDS